MENPISSSEQHESSNSDENHVEESSLQVPSESSIGSLPPLENDGSNPSSELVEPLELSDVVEEPPPADESGSKEVLESPQTDEESPKITESPPEDVELSNVVETGSQEVFEDSREYSSIESEAGDFAAPSPPQEQQSRSYETRPHLVPEPAVLSNDTHEVRSEEFAEPSLREPPGAHEDEPEEAAEPYDSSSVLYNLPDVSQASRELEDRPHEPSEALEVHGTIEQYEPSPASDHEEVEDIDELLEKIALEKKLLERAYEQDRVFPGSDLQEMHEASNQNEPSPASSVQESRSVQVHGTGKQYEPESPESDVQEIKPPQAHGARKQHNQIPGSELLERIRSKPSMNHVTSPASDLQEIKSPQVHGTSNQDESPPASDVQESKYRKQIHEATKHYEPSLANDLQEIRTPQVHGSGKQYETSPVSDLQEIRSSQVHGEFPASDEISAEPDAAAGPYHDSGNNVESSSPMTLVHEIIETIHVIASKEDFKARKKECSAFIRRVNMLLPLFVEFRDSALPVSDEIFTCFSSFDAALDSAKSLILLCNEGSKLYLVSLLSGRGSTIIRFIVRVEGFMMVTGLLTSISIPDLESQNSSRTILVSEYCVASSTGQVARVA